MPQMQHLLNLQVIMYRCNARKETYALVKDDVSVFWVAPNALYPYMHDCIAFDLDAVRASWREEWGATVSGISIGLPHARLALARHLRERP